MNKSKILNNVIAFLLHFILFWCITFTLENVFVRIFFSTGPDARMSAAPTSHTGQWVLALILVLIMPQYFKAIAALSKKIKFFSNIWTLALVSMIFCYAGELLIGIVLNIWLKLDAWDYKNMVVNGIPLHFLGQINIVYAPIWYLVGLFSLIFYRILYAFDMEIVTRITNEVKLVATILFKHRGDFKKVDPDYIKEIEADYLKSTRL